MLPKLGKQNTLVATFRAKEMYLNHVEKKCSIYYIIIIGFKSNIQVIFTAYYMKDKKEEYLENIYNQYASGVFRFIYFKVSDYELAKDLTQDVFVRFWKVLMREEKVQNPRALIYFIANGIVVDNYRRKNSNNSIPLEKIDERLLAKDDDIEEQVDRRKRINQIFAKLKEIKIDYQKILVLYYIEELKVSEIAIILKKRENAIRVLIHRALNALKEKL